MPVAIKGNQPIGVGWPRWPPFLIMPPRILLDSRPVWPDTPDRVMGNAFARHYFHWDTNGYFEDLTASLAKDLPSEFHIDYTFEGQDRTDAVIDLRYAQWRSKRP